MLGVLLNRWGIGEGERQRGEGSAGSGRDFCLVNLFCFLTGVGEVVGVGQGEEKNSEYVGTGRETLFFILPGVGNLEGVGQGGLWVQWEEVGTDNSFDGERKKDDSGIF